ncbi:MAG: amidase [Actinomycetes bacterium]
MDQDDLMFAGLARQAEMVRGGQVTSVELVTASLDRIERFDGLLNSFRVVMRDEAIAAAKAADAAGASGGGPLHGVPVAIKNDTDVAGQPTGNGSRATSSEPKQHDAEAVRRLRQAGAILVGTTNVPELTIFPFTESEAFGLTRNPWNTAHTPGGSSGGSAAAVAAGFVGGALGSDGGGSIRIPASCCGLVGIKPQRGRVPIAPKADAWYGLSVLGPLARRVVDAALLLDVLADGDGRYLTAAGTTPDPLRIGYSAKTPLPGPIGAEQRRAMEQAVGVLERLGHSTSEVKPGYGTAIPAFLPRYFRGISDDAAAVERPELLESRTKGMARIGRLIGDGVLARAMQAESSSASRLNRIFDSCDVFVTPGLAAQPLPVGKYRDRGALWAFNGVARFTPYAAPWNMTGQPAISLPAGFDRDGLPLAVQLVGPPDSEELLISLAAQFEADRQWADARPNLTA